MGKQYRNLFELTNDIGFEQIDAEIELWIEVGEFDEAVKERAAVLGYVHRHEPEPLSNTMQETHRFYHPNGPWGWEFCAVCAGVINELR